MANGDDASSHPLKVKTEHEQLAIAEAEASYNEAVNDELALQMDVPQLDFDLIPGRYANNPEVAPKPKVPKPPPKMRPPQWMAPPPAPPPVREEDEEYESEYEASVSAGSHDGAKAANLDFIRLSKLAEFLAVNRGAQRNCCSLPVTLALWISLIILIFHHGQARSCFLAQDYIRQSVMGAVAPARMPMDGVTLAPRLLQPLAMADISDMSDVYRWAEDGLVELLTPAPHTPGSAEYAGQTSATTYGTLSEGAEALVGYVRMTQLRGTSSTECAKLSSKLQDYHKGGCHPPSEGSLSKYGINVSSTDDAFVPNADNEKTFVAWLEVGRAKSSVKERFQTLQDGVWLDLQTQAVEIDALFVSAPANIFSHLTITLTLDRTGLLTSDVKVDALQANTYTHWTHTFYDVAWMACLCIFILASSNQVMQASNNGVLKVHLMDPFTMLDVAIVGGGFVLGLFFWILSRELNSLEEIVAEVGGTSPMFAVNEAPQTRLIEMVVKNREYQKTITEAISKHHLLTRANVNHRLAAFWYSIAIAMRFTRGLSGQPRIAVLIQVVYITMDYLAHFLVVACVCFFNFALAGYILFGEQIHNWSGFGHCIRSLLLVVFGRFEYEELHDAAPILSTFWFWAVFIFLNLLLLNILTAAALHNYKIVKKRLGEPGASIAEQVKELLGTMRFGNTYEGTQKSIPYDVLLHSLVEGAEYKHLEKVGRLVMDRRLRTRADLAKEETDPQVDVEYLLDRGCDVSTAEHLLATVTRWATQIAMNTEPEHRLAVKCVRQMRTTKADTTNLRERLRPRVNFAAAIVDRSDLKQAKCLSMAKRIKKSQEVPAGWEVHFLDNGKRYLRHKETGLTAWTLPRRMVK